MQARAKRAKDKKRVGGCRGSWLRRAWVFAAAAAAGTTMLQVPAYAATSDPYTSGSSGFDISYPDCSATLPSGDAFAIVGVGGGRPFTSNSCAGSEWLKARTATGSTPSLYFNTGYSGAYGRYVDSTCTSEVGSAGVFAGLVGHSLRQAEQAWEIGCSEAEYAFVQEPGQPLLWWADVETGNSWSANPQLNRFALDGISYQVQALGGGGIYSSPAMWAAITGDSSWAPTPAVAGDWVTGASCSASFGGAPDWLSQGSAVNGVDADTAC